MNFLLLASRRAETLKAPREHYPTQRRQKTSMPPNNGSRNHPQPRIFRGKGGPTDGNLPPKKVIRRKVKYQPQQQALDHTTDNVVDVLSVRNLALNDEISATAAVDDAGAKETNRVVDEDVDNGESMFHQELQHIQKRIQYVTLSNKTSKGLVNPSTWRTNCLIPTRKVVKEWRNILMFHNILIDNNLIDSSSAAENEIRSDVIQEKKNKDLLISTSQQVFSLIQMSLQVGPLVGSNPGYFKRCGGEVASIAVVYLCEIAELAGIDESIMMMNDNISQYDDDDDDEKGLLLVDNDQKKGEHLNDVDCYSGSSSSDEDLLEMVSSDSLCSSDNESMSPLNDEIVDESDVVNGNSLSGSITMPNNDSREEVIVNKLQTMLLFTTNQSMKLYHWLRNAKHAVTINRPPSKSAIKLQSGKSKKQTIKELKLQRKLKKKKGVTRGTESKLR
jgi:hypothetical protein